VLEIQGDKLAELLAAIAGKKGGKEAKNKATKCAFRITNFLIAKLRRKYKLHNTQT